MLAERDHGFAHLVYSRILRKMLNLVIGPVMTQETQWIQLFVYGTLMRGEVGHRILGAAEFVAETQTEAVYTLVDLGDYPALLKGGSQTVAGELYRVHVHELPALDEYEDCPEIYAREQTTLACGQRAHIYVGIPGLETDHAVIPSGNWRQRNI